jgi:ferrous iron transport protein B
VAEVLRLGLVGSPNAGKTTLFNALTGLRSRVGNYPGVTVERREGALTLAGRRVVVIDLPGTYSLDPISADEAVVRQVIDNEIQEVEAPHGLIIVADACSLERSLLLVAQVLARGRPTCLVLSMIDELRARGGSLDRERLEAALGIPVVEVVGHRGHGLANLRQQLADPSRWPQPQILPPEDPHERGAWADSIASHVIVQRPTEHAISAAVDRVVLHPVWGSLLFAAVMVTFFQLIFAWAAPTMDWIDGVVGSASAAVHAALPASLLADFLADGLIAGVGSVVIFLPQIILLFAMLYLLEDIGYMARAAFLVDRVMGRIGLEGRSFVALLSSYACAVPGIMATRTIPSPRDRLVTILVAPLMTCSARLPVYALLIGTFVPASQVWGPLGLQGLVLLGLYLAGPVVALAVAAVLKKTLLRGEGLPFTMELPSYRMPTLRLWLSQVGGSAWAFLRRAGTIILAVSILLWLLLTFPRLPETELSAASDRPSAALQYSFAGRAGHALEPLIAPLGFDWKIGVGLIASLAAREVIVSTLAQIYAVEDEGSSLRAAIRADRHRNGEPIYSPATVAALLVFFVFALQCMSTLAVMRRETNSWKWPAFAFGYMLVLAWTMAFTANRVVGALVANS